MYIVYFVCMLAGHKDIFIRTQGHLVLHLGGETPLKSKGRCDVHVKSSSAKVNCQLFFVCFPEVVVVCLYTGTITSRFLCIKIIDCNVKKFGNNEHLLISSSFWGRFFCIFLLVVSGTRYTTQYLRLF